jgi:uncharacterized repeat protein (TIGR01451 family)
MRKILLLIVLMLFGARVQAQNCFVSVNIPNPCAQGCAFSAVLFFQGPNMPFTVTITGPSFSLGPVVVTSSLTLPNLCPGTYLVNVTDNLGQPCTQTNFVVNPFSPPTLAYQVTNATCPTCNDGAVVLSASGGAPPYTFGFNGSTASFVNNLLPGDYFASVTDANGCTDWDTVSVGVGNSGFYTVSGTVYLDVNNNGIKDVGEPGMSNQSAELMPGNINMISGATGGYGSVVSPGTYDISYLPSAGWSLSSTPSSYNVTVSNASVTGFDFGVYPNNTTAGGNISLTSGLPRCFWTVPHYLYFYNNGFTPLSGSLAFTYDPLMTFVNSSVTPTSQVGNTLSYSFTNLFPGQSFMATVSLIEPASGNIVSHYLTANAGDAFGNQLALSDTLQQTVLCSYDPNDKAVYPSGIGPLNYVPMNQRLEYLVRFQNTGNDTAFKVVIIDTLDAKLDPSSFNLLGNSHPVLTELDGNGKLTFTFDNILLPDSNVNEPASHGYVLYGISGLASNPDPTSVNNTAYIYFDQNPPIQTNTTLTTFSDNYLGVDDLASISGLSISPNPFNSEAVVECEDCQGEYLMQVIDMLGKVVHLQEVSGTRWTLYKGSLSPGTYLLEVRSRSTNQLNRLKITVY